MPINHRIVLDNRPQGEATANNFKMVELPLPELKEGEVLVCHHYLSLDPYMRGRMNESKSYAVPQPLGDVMIGGTVGEVVDSRHPKFKAGDQVVGMGGWQEYSVVDANVFGALRKVDTTHVPLSHYLGAVGMPGVTAGNRRRDHRQLAQRGQIKGMKRVRADHRDNAQNAQNHARTFAQTKLFIGKKQRCKEHAENRGGGVENARKSRGNAVLRPGDQQKWQGGGQAADHNETPQIVAHWRDRQAFDQDIGP